MINTEAFNNSVRLINIMFAFTYWQTRVIVVFMIFSKNYLIEMNNITNETMIKLSNKNKGLITIRLNEIITSNTDDIVYYVHNTII